MAIVRLPAAALDARWVSVWNLPHGVPRTRSRGRMPAVPSDSGAPSSTWRPRWTRWRPTAGVSTTAALSAGTSGVRRHVVVLARRPRTGPRSGWELGEGMHVDVPVGIDAGATTGCSTRRPSKRNAVARGDLADAASPGSMRSCAGARGTFWT